MSCWGNEGYKPSDVKGQCPDCESNIDEEGVSLDSCFYSSEECKTCGWSPCDGSC